MTETYAKWRVPELWQMVEGESGEDVQAHLVSLRRQQIALETQRDRLRFLLDQLVQGWPPEKNEASLAFVGRVEDMIRAMSVTAQGAAEIRSGLDHIAQALATARTELAPLVTQYDASAKFIDLIAQRKMALVLDHEARTILMAADRAVTEPAQALEFALPDYSRLSDRSEVATVGGDGGASSSPKGGGTNSGTLANGVRSNSKQISAVANPVFEPPAPSVSASQDGFSLTSGAGLRGATAGATGIGNQIAGSMPVQVLPAPGHSSNTYIGAVVGRQSAGSNLRSSNEAGRKGRQLRPPAASGGVIGGAPDNAGRSAVGGPGGMRAGVGSAAADARHRSRDEADQTWSVREGVPSILEAPKAVPALHDPGRGVLGIDR